MGGMLEGNKESRLLAALAYFLAALTGLFLVLYRREDRFVRFHALQAILGSVVFTLFGFLLWILGNLPIIGFLYVYLLKLYLLGLFLCWLFLMSRAWKGEKYLLPYLGRFIERELE
jgi:uncharacterized membrane protein